MNNLIKFDVILCRWSESQQGFKCSQKSAPRKDFALFMHIQMIGANSGFCESDKMEKSNVEGKPVIIAIPECFFKI